MQISNADENSSRRVGVAEHLIKFKSSPNFKTMKKFIRCKMDRNEMTSPPSPVNSHDPPPPPNVSKVQVVKPEMQPPLPLEPPPADISFDLNIPIKREIIDTEYNVSDNKSENASQDCDASKSKEHRVSKEICRDFLRGNCYRKGLCRFSHKYETLELQKLYTFCHKYQNSGCTYSNCRYVHATVFEERKFYRTGFLPPHVLAPKTVPVMQPPPPPPPPPPPVEDPPFKVPAVAFPNPPPSVPNNIKKGGTGLGVETGSLKRPWTSLEEQLSPAKKCKHCDTIEFRLQYNREKVERMRQNKLELELKMAALDRKTDRLSSIILTLLQPALHGPSTPDKECSLLEQLSSVLGAGSRLSAT